MPSDVIETLLKSDFETLAGRFEKDRFAERVLFKLGARRRARLGVVAFAGGLGAAFAASQFFGVVKALIPSFSQSAPETAAVLGAPQLLATLMIAGALAATALVLRQET